MVGRSGKSFALGMVLSTLLWGCVSAQFSYKWYYPNLTSYDGTLLGPTAAEDLPGSVCGLDPVTHDHGCVVMRKTDFKAMYQDYLDTKNKLITCERGN